MGRNGSRWITRMVDKTIKRGEIWVSDLRPGLWGEIAKKRPAIVISSNPINKFYSTVIIIPLTSQKYNVIGPERLELSAEDTGLVKDSFALVTQMRAVDKKRLIKKSGSISRKKMFEVEESLKLVLGLIPLE